MRSLCSVTGTAGAAFFFATAFFTAGTTAFFTARFTGFFALVAVGMLLVGTWLSVARKLRGNFRDDAGAHRLTAFADGEALLLFERDRRDELHLEGDRVARHDHLLTLRERHFSRDVGGTDRSEEHT